MDLKEYIASGILEAYVLGQVSPQEKQEVECLSSIYPAVNEALEAFQVSMEKVADQNAITPPEDLKEKVLSTVYEKIDQDQKDEIIEHDFTSSKKTTAQKKDQKNNWKLMAAAFFALFLIATTVFINTKSDNNELEEKVAALKSDVQSTNEKMKNVSSNYVAQLEQKNEFLSFLSDTNTRRVLLKGTDLSKTSLVNVFWNQDDSRVVLQVEQLPDAPTKKQYQLWAIVDGQPKNMGVLPKKQETAFIEISKTTKAAGAFAITLEDEGGRPEPNLDQLYVIGNV
ncbi:MAG: anti-sigma factor [Bacteroidota bacterium]